MIPSYFLGSSYRLPAYMYGIVVASLSSLMSSQPFWHPEQYFSFSSMHGETWITDAVHSLTKQGKYFQNLNRISPHCSFYLSGWLAFMLCTYENVQLRILAQRHPLHHQKVKVQLRKEGKHKCLILLTKGNKFLSETTVDKPSIVITCQFNT